MAEPVLQCRIMPHAAVEMRRREIDSSILQQVLTAPEQRHTVRAGRDVLQSKVQYGGKAYPVR